MKHTSRVKTEIEVTLALSGQEFEDLYRLLEYTSMAHYSAVPESRFMPVTTNGPILREGFRRVREDLRAKHYGYPGVR